MKSGDNIKLVRMGMVTNWQAFIDRCRDKDKSHTNTAHCWSITHNTLTLVMIFLSAITAGGALLDSIPKYALAIIGAIGTIVSSVASFLQPAKKSAAHDEAAKFYRFLMMEMAHCETEKRYDDLWKEFNNYVLKDPRVIVCFKASTEMSWTMTPELTLVALAKDSEANIQAPFTTIEVDAHPKKDFGCDGVDDLLSGQLEDSGISQSPHTRQGYQKLPSNDHN